MCISYYPPSLLVNVYLSMVSSFSPLPCLSDAKPDRYRLNGHDTRAPDWLRRILAFPYLLALFLCLADNPTLNQCVCFESSHAVLPLLLVNGYFFMIPLCSVHYRLSNKKYLFVAFYFVPCSRRSLDPFQAKPRPFPEAKPRPPSERSLDPFQAKPRPFPGEASTLSRRSLDPFMQGIIVFSARRFS